MSELRGSLIGDENILAGQISNEEEIHGTLDDSEQKLRGELSIPELINYGTIHTAEMLYDTVEGWNSQVQLKSKAKTTYVYTDYGEGPNGEPIAAFKLGDGNAYLIDLPFYATVSATDKQFWNDKVSVYVDPLNPENLIFTTN